MRFIEIERRFDGQRVTLPASVVMLLEQSDGSARVFVTDGPPLLPFNATERYEDLRARLVRLSDEITYARSPA